MEENQIINTIINKANVMLQALNNIEVKGRTNLNNLSYTMSLLEEIVKSSVDEINKLNASINELQSKENKENK